MTTVKPILRFYDYDKTIDFYINWLGFKVDWEHEFGPGMPKFLQVSFRDISFHLSEHHGDGSPNTHVNIQNFENLRIYHQELIGKRYKYNRPGLEVPEWDAASITVTVIDPVGNQLTFSERVG